MASVRPKKGETANQARSQIELVTRTLEEYAKRGVFKGFSPGAVGGSKASYRIAWHRDQVFELTFDASNRSFRFADVLPNVPASSLMYRQFKQFVKSRQDDDMPEHRRIDRRKASVQCTNRGGSVSLTLKISGGDCEYGVRKLVHLVHEIYMTFLVDGGYLEYLVETFDLDPDSMS